ncbi:MAG: CO dehydrogenase/CO-methylating acetyl-CoA synthase complex subunit beta, partial [Treponema sp.]|nr:CO dehydrogenase/CO-methylating acetyl-CoA synthase complex subunit beta [Treponema sp.]
MKLLFNRVFDGVDEMYAVAEKTLNETVKELGESAPLNIENTAFFLANHLAYLGKKITTLGELKAAFPEVKVWMPHEQRLADVFKSGFGTVMAAEVIEACKYAKNPAPYSHVEKDSDGNEVVVRDYWGHMSDAEVRELGVPLVTGDIPGFVVIIGPAPSDEEAVELIKGYQSRAIFVFLIGGIIDQAKRMKVNM